MLPPRCETGSACRNIDVSQVHVPLAFILKPSSSATTSMSQNVARHTTTLTAMSSSVTSCRRLSARSTLNGSMKNTETSPPSADCIVP